VGYTGTSSLGHVEGATDAVVVPVRRMDALSERLGLTRIDLMKVDVEGAEADVLKGAQGILHITDRIVLETDRRGTGREVRAFLAAHGFRLSHTTSNVWDDPDLEILAFERRRESVSAA
jgi:hypothetical protein